MITWMVALAFAADTTCQSCCVAATGGSCAAEIVVMGDQGQVSRESGGAYSVRGAWVLGCDGRTSYDSSRYVQLDHLPRPGEVLGQGVTPVQLHCFRQACSLPEGVCFSTAGAYGAYSLQDCKTAAPVDIAFVSPGKARRVGSSVVLVDGKPLVVERVSVNLPSAASVPAASVPVASAPAASVPVASAWSTPTTTAPPSTAAASTSSAWSSPTTTTPQPASSTSSAWSNPTSTPVAAPVAATPAAATSSSSKPVGPDDPAVTAALASIPPDPPEECRAPGDAIRAEARKRADSGDEKRMRREYVSSINEYRAALAMDPCNGYGWLGLGEAAVAVSRPDVAIRALRNTTRLMPGHYGAWTSLGLQYELIGQYKSSAEAFSKALEVRPDHAAAVSGLARVKGK